MYISHREALLVAEAIHNPEAEGCLIAGRVWNITSTMIKEQVIREV
jgi:hypothetical protein